VILDVRANTPEEAINLVRQEFWYKSKRAEDEATKRLMQQLGAAAGLDPAMLDQMRFCELGIEMPSAKFESLALRVTPQEIDGSHIEWVRDESGANFENTRHWRYQTK
jgi:hypothetical protein